MEIRVGNNILPGCRAFLFSAGSNGEIGEMRVSLPYCWIRFSSKNSLFFFALLFSFVPKKKKNCFRKKLPPPFEMIRSKQFKLKPVIAYKKLFCVQAISCYFGDGLYLMMLHCFRKREITKAC